MDSTGILDTMNIIQKVVRLGNKATNLQYEEALLAARETIVNLREENLVLKEENAMLKTSDDIKNQMKHGKGGEFWYDSRPHCSGCMGSKNKLIPLSHYSGHTYVCPVCKSSYYNVKSPE